VQVIRPFSPHDNQPIVDNSLDEHNQSRFNPWLSPSHQLWLWLIFLGFAAESPSRRSTVATLYKPLKRK
jgi:hypothetical protein